MSPNEVLLGLSDMSEIHRLTNAPLKAARVLRAMHPNEDGYNNCGIALVQAC